MQTVRSGPGDFVADRFKAVRTDRELECPGIDAGLGTAGCDLVVLPDGVSEDDLIAAARRVDLLLMCYTPVTARVIAAAEKLKGIVKYGVGIDAIDIDAAGFRVRVAGYDPYVPAKTMRGAGIEKVADLPALLAMSDVVSLHAVLNAETRHLIGAHELAAMSPSALLINTARGALVDEAALVAALCEKRIAGAALDVYGNEPLHPGDPMSALAAMDNVILFPHLTFYTEEAMARLEADTLARCREILEGRSWSNRTIRVCARSATG
jgi:phosphoglycerate dehydrogenase-like enzyme